MNAIDKLVAGLGAGKIFKRCKCRGEDGKELGKSCPKLRRKGGSWSSGHGTWYFQVDVGKRAQGSRRTVKRGGFSSREEAEEALEALQGNVASGFPIAKPETVGEYLDRWLKAKKGVIAKKTYLSYRGHIENYWKPHIGAIELSKLKVVNVENVFAWIDERNEMIEEAKSSPDPMVRAKVRGRRKVGAASKQRFRATLRAALNDACAEQIISVNVASLCKLPAGRRPRPLVWTPERVEQWKRTGQKPSSVMVWTPDHAAQFLNFSKKHRLFPLFRLVLFRGLRRGEAVGLRWSDIRMEKKEIDIQNQRIEVDYEVFDTPPKSEAGLRTVALDVGTAQALVEWRSRQVAERLKAGASWVDNEYVFTRSNGEPWHPSTVSGVFDTLVRESGLPHIRFHDTRHFGASAMYAAGQDVKKIQTTLGHSSSALTMDTYTSVFPDAAHDEAEAVAAVIPMGKTG